MEQSILIVHSIDNFDRIISVYEREQHLYKITFNKPLDFPITTGKGIMLRLLKLYPDLIDFNSYKRNKKDRIIHELHPTIMEYVERYQRIKANIPELKTRNCTTKHIEIEDDYVKYVPDNLTIHIDIREGIHYYYFSDKANFMVNKKCIITDDEFSEQLFTQMMKAFIASIPELLYFPDFPPCKTVKSSKIC